MTIKTILFCSAATLLANSAAHAADPVVVAEPEAVEYVRVCDAYGQGYFYIPGTETCLRIHGYVRYDLTGGNDVYGRGFEARDGKLFAKNNKRDTYEGLARFSLRFSTASETELGTLKTYSDLRFQWKDGVDAKSTGTLRAGYIQLGGLKIGLDDSAFITFPGYLGNVMNDDVILAGSGRTGQISYTFTGDNGLSAILSLEQGGKDDVDEQPKDWAGKKWGAVIKDYTPHVVGGLRYAQGWGSLTAVAAYDAYNKEWAGKIRGDLNVTDSFSVWTMGGYKSNKDNYIDVLGDNNQVIGQVRAISSFYGTWGGDWAVWGGAAYKLTPQAVLNAQLAYDASKTFAATANVSYELVPGFSITPEVSYTKWKDKKSIQNGKDAVQGMIRFQRSF
ncbi:porin [Bacillus subtilis]|uniref:porin n=1 Tax=Pseudochrobactrum asaccharolyticum TaxID=354351 RepID=UPI001F24B691|nr:porin [Pseudochrobactrum asaccharolyticum]MCF7646770.1 porin [Pseudochrobactrum asaccharolyticum]MCF7672595.1 porin [Bacillus subtilis]